MLYYWYNLISVLQFLYCHQQLSNISCIQPQEKLKGAQLEHTPELVLNNNVDEKRATPISTENLLSRVNNNSGSVDRAGVVGEESHRFEKNSNNGAKLHQLLDTSPRADAVAAG